MCVCVLQIMILCNGFAFELFMLCLFYTPPTPRQEGDPVYTINIVGILIGGTFASLIVVPMCPQGRACWAFPAAPHSVHVGVPLLRCYSVLHIWGSRTRTV